MLLAAAFLRVANGWADVMAMEETANTHMGLHFRQTISKCLVAFLWTLITRTQRGTTRAKFSSASPRESSEGGLSVQNVLGVSPLLGRKRMRAQGEEATRRTFVTNFAASLAEAASPQRPYQRPRDNGKALRARWGGGNGMAQVGIVSPGGG